MTDELGDSSAPLVSVIVRASGEPGALAATLRSVCRQTYPNLQTIVTGIRGGWADRGIDTLSDLPQARQAVLLRLDPDAGCARATNAALRRAEGEYLAYIDEGDLFYPRHVERLVAALRRCDDCGVAYGDHYRTYCRCDGDGRRRVLSKVLSGNAGFDRLRLCRRDYIPQTSLLHRRDLLDRTGPCAEHLKHLVDWDLIRRLAFYSDFLYLPVLTAERRVPVRDGGRITDASDGRTHRRRLTDGTTQPARRERYCGWTSCQVSGTARAVDETLPWTLLMTSAL